MSDIFNPAATPQQPFDKNSIPIRFGLLTGFISMFITTISFLYVLRYNYFLFLGIITLGYIIPIILYAMAGIRQRKAMGGYISLKEAFRAIFIVVLIYVIISSIYGLIYVKYIDPDAMVRMKEGTLALFEKTKLPQEQIDEKMAQFDKDLANSTKPGMLLYSMAKQIVIQSIFGFICALIIKKTIHLLHRDKQSLSPISKHSITQYQSSANVTRYIYSCTSIQ